MASVFRTRRAQMDIDGIVIDLGLESPTLGRRFLTNLDRQFVRYSSMPETGVLRDDIDMELRCFFVWNYIVFYYPSIDGIVIARVLHGSRDTGPSQFSPFS